MRRILITGASGLLGGACLWAWREAGHELGAVLRDPGAWPAEGLAGVERLRGDLGDPQGLAALVESWAPDLVVSSAALTRVDACQADPELCGRLNAEAPAALARAAARAGAALVQISTDAVYAQGPGPHAEDAAGGELSRYAAAKRAGEAAVLAEHPGALVLRTVHFGWNLDPGRSSLAEWIAATLGRGEGLTGFTDVRFSPLFTATSARAVLAAATAGLAGVYNLGSGAGLSKYDFARLLARGLGLDQGLVRPGRVDEGNLAAPRPPDPTMDSARLWAALGEAPPAVADEIDHFLAFRASGELARFRAWGGKA